MSENAHDHTISIVPDTLSQAKTAYEKHKEGQGKTPHTVELYCHCINKFIVYCHNRHVYHLAEISPGVLDAFFSRLRTDHNAGGVHHYYRAIKAWLRWYWITYDLDTRCPIEKVKIEAPAVQPKRGIPIDHWVAMIHACKTKNSLRDKAMLMCLLDSCARASEFCSLNIGDVDFTTGAVLIKLGKGKKSRSVRFGDKSLRALRKYLKTRGDSLPDNQPLFLTDSGERFDRFSLRLLMDRRANNAHVPHYGLHDFRRRGARELLRNGMDIKTISAYLGHTTVAVTERYLKIEDEEIMTSHRRTSPVDNADI